LQPKIFYDKGKPINIKYSSIKESRARVRWYLQAKIFYEKGKLINIKYSSIKESGGKG